MRFLRTNTAVRLTVGPFFDKTDGVTPETALTTTSCKLTLMVDDANVPTLVLDANATASGGNNDMVHVTGDDAGFYDLELTAANLNYLGRAMLAITDAATHCPVFHEFMILPAMIYDSLVLGSDRFDANVTHIADTSQTARDIGASVLVGDKTGFSLANSSIVTATFGTCDFTNTMKTSIGTAVASSSVAGVTGNVDGSVGGIASGGITSASFGAGAINAAAIATDAITEMWGADLSGAHLAGTAAHYLQSVHESSEFFNDMIELDGSVYRFTTNTLELGPTNSASSIRTAIGMTAADLDDQLDAIIASFDGVTVVFTDNVPANGGRSIIQENDYNSTIGNALIWTFTGMPTIPADATVLLTAVLGDTTFSVAGERVSSTSVKVEIDGSLTTQALLPAGTYKMQVDVASTATWGVGKEVTYVDAALLVKRKV